jgi:hypothetical protein
VYFQGPTVNLLEATLWWTNIAMENHHY